MTALIGCIKETGTQASEGAIATQIVSGGQHTCALLATGSVKCWGSNSYGQLGVETNEVCIEKIYDGSAVAYETSFQCSTRPVDVSGLSNVRQIALGKNHSCALINDGSVKCWGDSSSGRLGFEANEVCGENPRTNPCSKKPVTISDLNNVIQIALGDNHSCAVLSDKTVKCWGYNYYGQLGNSSGSSNLNKQNSVSMGSSVNAGEQSNVSLTDSSQGSPPYPSMDSSQGSTTGEGSAESSVSSVTPVLVSSLSNVRQISLGQDHSCALLDDDTSTTDNEAGTVKCWGNSYLDNDSSGEESSTPILVPNLSNVSQISLAYLRSCALINDGSVKCWGYNLDGWFGGSSTTNRNIPVNSFGLTNVRQFSLGASHVCAILNDDTSTTANEAGTVKCWGDNSIGRLGDGTTSEKSVPVKAIGLSDVKQISSGGYHTCALSGNRSVHCWGRNVEGQLGVSTKILCTDNDIKCSPVPALNPVFQARNQ